MCLESLVLVGLKRNCIVIIEDFERTENNTETMQKKRK